MERTEVAWGEHRPRARLVAVPVVEAHAVARGILARAEAAASAVVEDAELHREAVRDDARSAGRLEGLVEAQELLVDLQRRRAELLNGPAVRRFAIVLGLAVAERILGDRRLTDPEAWGQACAAALEALRPARTLRLRVGPGQGPGVRAALAALPGVGVLEVTVEEDATLGEPGCIAESECGRVDGLLSTQLAAIGRVLLPEPAE